MTAVAEGIWMPSSGQLCMLACHGSNGSICDSRICLYIPVSFSISRRSSVMGTISSIKDFGAGFYPLLFHKSLRQDAFRSYFTSIQARYSYTKLKEARTILERNQPTTLQTKIKKSLLHYPKPEDNDNHEISWYTLVEDLSFQSLAFPLQDRNHETLVSFDILSVGVLLSRHWEFTPIEVIISYPPTNTLWLAIPKAEISIVSRRNDDDPLLFNPIKLQTSPLMYRKQRQDILSTISVETALQILALAFGLTCILSQVFYVGTHPACAPFTSLVMLEIQALGLSVTLIGGSEALFKEAPATSYGAALQTRDCIVKVLVLLSLLLSLRLCQKVWKCRSRLQSTSVQASHLPSDKPVFLITSIVHVIGFAVVLYAYPTNKLYTPFPEGSNRTPQWKTELEEYIGLVQDFFLLPQVIANFLWKTDGKPLGKVYYIGITMVRVLPHLYDYFHPSPLTPLADYNFANPTKDFYTKFGDIIISAIALIFAVMVYLQQTWSVTKVWSGTSSSIKSKYDRVPSTVQLAFGGDNEDDTD